MTNHMELAGRRDSELKGKRPVYTNSKKMQKRLQNKCEKEGAGDYW